jgi:subtilisin family serine protease
MADARLPTAPSTGESPSRTFQGRPVVTMDWSGQRVEAMAGVRAVRFSSLGLESRERGATVLAGRAPALGIAVVDERMLVALERGAGIGLEAATEWDEPVLLDHGAGIPDDPLLSQQWALDTIAAGAAWDLPPANGEVVIAVLDSGLPMEAGQLSHADLSDGGRLHRGEDLVNFDADPSDDHGHGTHVLGVLGATRNNATGIAGLWPGPLLVVKVFDSSLTGSSVTFKDGVAAAVEFAGARGARLVINYSGGGPPSATKLAAVEHARENGALLVAAAGNSAVAALDHPAAYAGAFDHVIAVGAVDEFGRRPAFASTGPELTVVAPAVSVLSTMPNYNVTLNRQGKQTKYDRLDGTSQATPHAAAIAALVWAQRPDLPAAAVREHLRSTAVPVPGGDPAIFGGGIVNLERARPGRWPSFAVVTSNTCGQRPAPSARSLVRSSSGSRPGRDGIPSVWNLSFTNSRRRAPWPLRWIDSA